MERIEPIQQVSNSTHKYYFDNGRIYRETDNKPVSETENMSKEALNDFVGRNLDEKIY